MRETKLYRGRDLLEDLRQVGERLPRPIDVYLIGGCAMSLKNLKEFTKDVDAVFTAVEDLNSFEKELRKQGYANTFKTEAEYDQLGASSVLRRDDRTGYDLFHLKVCNMLVLSPNMLRRATKYAVLSKLSVFLVSNEDIALFKGITERPRDLEDIFLLITQPGRNFDWNALKEECAKQSEHLKIEGRLYERFLELFEKHEIRAPILSWLKKRGQKHLLQDAYETRLQKGFTHQRIMEQFKNQGFNKKELTLLARLNKK